MRTIITGLLLAAVVALGAPTAEARPSLKTTYSSLYYAVKHKHGADAPGRNIRRWGVKTRRGSRDATARELASSVRTLRSMLPRYNAMLTPGSPRQPPAGIASMRAGGTLAAIRSCESGGNYTTDTGNSFYGAYQFTLSTWASVGGSGNPAAASPAEQDRRAAMLYQREGASPWPVCGR